MGDSPNIWTVDPQIISINDQVTHHLIIGTYSGLSI